MLISQSSLSLSISVMGSILLTEVTMAQVKPSCFMIDTSGTVIDLSDLCNSRSNRASNIKNTENLNNIVNTTINESALVNNAAGETVYFVGDGSVPFKLGSSANSYYTGKQPVYLRRYQSSQTLGNIEASRNALLSSGERFIVPARTPFILYRYQK